MNGLTNMAVFQNRNGERAGMSKISDLSDLVYLKNISGNTFSVWIFTFLLSYIELKLNIVTAYQILTKSLWKFQRNPVRLAHFSSTHRDIM